MAPPVEVKVISPVPADLRGSDEHPLIVTKPEKESQSDKTEQDKRSLYELINTVIAFLLAVVTGALALYTASMARATKLMAIATKQMAEIETIPYLSFVSLSFNQIMKAATPFTPERSDGLVPFVQFKNPGKVRVIFVVHKIEFLLNGVSYPVLASNGRLVIHPDELSAYFFPTIPTDFRLEAGMSGEAGLLVEYWSVEAERHYLSLKVKYALVTTDALAAGKFEVSWVFVEGPEYGLWKDVSPPLSVNSVQ